MVDLLVVAAFALLIGGVVGAVLPLLPGAPLSLVGVALYRWATGEPGLFLTAALVVACLAAFAADLGAGAVGASSAGASRRVAVLATVVGVAALFLVGPLGLIVGVAGTVFLGELARGNDPAAGAKAAAVAVVGVFGSALVQVLLLASVLVAVTVVAL
jgi:uncharacterized protein YqgC (DUF456 family)